MRIVADVMGGDHGCPIVIDGIKLALREFPGIDQFHLVGDQAQIEAALGKTLSQDPRLRIVHASQVLTMQDKPVDALRKKKDCSIARAVELLKEGKADALISTGNTGGLVAATTIRLRPLPQIDRPAIATIIPADQNEFVLIDGGATPDCKPIHLAHFAIMGHIYSREILGHIKPRVGILSNGTEDIKGTELTRGAARLCEQLDLNFIGYIEGHDLFANRVDVVVTDGFVGNIVLKSIESMGKSMVRLLKRELTATPIRKLGALLSRGGLKSIKRRMNPDTYGGAPLLGLNGIVIKAHGSASAIAIMNAVGFASQAVQHQINQLISDEAAAANARFASANPPVPA